MIIKNNKTMKYYPRRVVCTAARILLVIAVLWTVLSGQAAENRPVPPFESDCDLTPNNNIDKIVLASLRKENISPANLCSDEVFVRRVYLDLTGTLPEPADVRRFLEDTDPNKRALLVDNLLTHDAFASYLTLKWCDLLRAKAEFPINLWPNAVQAYHRWIYEAVKKNMPYDKFARELLTSSGSNFRNPQVNFYRAIQGREPSAIAAAAALTFMGVRLENWPQEQRSRIETFFTRVAYKSTAEWKEEIVYLSPAATDSLKTFFPDGSVILIKPKTDPREVFAAWLTRPENPYFARNIVNRVWAWLLGRGIIHEPDDIRPDNPPAVAELLKYLEKELVKSKYDLRHIYRLIVNSRTYQQSSIPRSNHPEAEAMFAYYPVRRLDAEVLADALCLISGTTESYSSPIPEPFSFIPEENRSIDLVDGSTTSSFLEMFGRPARDTGMESERSNNISDAQVLHMLNSSHIQKKIENGPRLNRLFQTNRGNRQRLIKMIYLTVLSRYPLQNELDTAERYFQNDSLNQRQAANDLVWALINTKEFLFRH